MKKNFLYVSLVLLICSIGTYFLWKSYAFATEAIYILPIVIALLVTSLFFLILWIKYVTSARVFTYGFNSIIMVIAVLGILTLINFISYRQSYRKDFSGDQQFSLSNQTEKVLNKLDSDIKITAFYQDRDMPSRSRLEDLMEEYIYLNPGISYEFIDPIVNPAVALEYGVKAGTVILEFAGDDSKREKLTGEITEDSMTNAIMKLMKAENKVVYFLTGHKEAGLETELSSVKNALEKEIYEVRELALLKDLNIPSDCSLLIIAGPEKEIEEVEIEVINDYLLKGGKLMVLVDPMKAGLKDFLKKWNVTVIDDLVLDFSGVGQQIFGASENMPISLDYPPHEITKDMQSIATIFPIARSVEAIIDDENSGILVEDLILSLPGSWGFRGDLDKGQYEVDPSRDKEGPLSMALAISAPVNSEEDIDINEEKPKEETRIILAGNSMFIQNEFFTFQGNGDLFLNMVNWLTEQEDLISIRPKDPRIYNLELPASRSLIIFSLTIILFPLFFIILGVSVWLHRR